jgi:hypothetical protein
MVKYHMYLLVSTSGPSYLQGRCLLHFPQWAEVWVLELAVPYGEINLRSFE